MKERCDLSRKQIRPTGSGPHSSAAEDGRAREGTYPPMGLAVSLPDRARTIMAAQIRQRESPRAGRAENPAMVARAAERFARGPMVAKP